MSRQIAVLTLDPQRWNEQMAYISARGEIAHWSGDRPWMALTEDQVPRLEAEGISVVFPLNQDQIQTPALIFQPSTDTPVPPSAFAATEPGGADKAHYIVHFGFPPESAEIQSLLDSGATWVQELDYNAVVVSATLTQKAAINNLAAVDWVGLYHPA